MIELIAELFLEEENFHPLIILNRIDLYSQTIRRFKKALRKSIRSICGTLRDEDHFGEVTIGTINSLWKRRDSIANISHIIVDEAHRSTSKVYTKFLDSFPKAKLVGFTATPYIAGTRIYGEGRRFPSIAFERPHHQFIGEGFLVHPTVKASKEAFEVKGMNVSMGEWDMRELQTLLTANKVQKQVSDALPRTLGRKKCVWFCCTIEHAIMVHRLIQDLGEKAAIIHSKLSMEEREDNKRKFEKTACRHLTFVTIVSEGYDYPPIDCVLMMRPTRSATLYVQTVGRAMRPYPGKKDCLVLDYGRVIEHCGPINNPVVLSLKRKEAEKQVEQLLEKAKFCEVCLTYVFAPYPELCPDCGAALQKEREVKLQNKPEVNRPILEELSDLSKAQALEWKRTHIRNVTVEFGKSSNGNNQYVIRYYGGIHRVATEYLPVRSSYDWVQTKTERRLRELQVEEGKISVFGYRIFNAHAIPIEIVHRKNKNGWDEIKELVFANADQRQLGDGGERGREPDSSLVEQPSLVLRMEE